MAIYGYSERGIINSLLFAIGNDDTRMYDFISLIEIPNLFENGTPRSYDILLEQSFSRFGDADLVIIIKYDKPHKNKVLFIEGKVKTYQKRHWNVQKQYDEFNALDKPKKNTSNLFFQLHLKKLLIDNADKIYSNEIVDEIWYGTKRDIGKNPIVKKALGMVKDCEAHYVGLIPSTQNEINDFIQNTAKLNHHSIANQMHFLSWHTVKAFCLKKNLKNVLAIFDYNEQQIF
jgi:hypothetical protein